MSKRDKKLKIQGAVEALQNLLDDCRAHLYEIDENVVYNYLQETRKELAKL